MIPSIFLILLTSDLHIFDDACMTADIISIIICDIKECLAMPIPLITIMDLVVTKLERFILKFPFQLWGYQVNS